MESWGFKQRLAYGAYQSIGLGFVAGVMETVSLAASLKLPLSTVDFLMLGVAGSVIMGALGAVAGALGGALVLIDQRAEVSTADGAAKQMGVAGFLLCGYYLWQASFLVYSQSQPAAAVAMAVMPIGVGGVVYFNARFWLRRTQAGKPTPVGWVPAAGALALLIAIGSAVGYPMKNTGGAYALDGDPNILLISVDGLSHSDIGAGNTPAIDALAASGVRFENAVSPSNQASPANATLLTGLHPLRTKLLFDGDVLGRGYRTMAEGLGKEGYATGGFVSSSLAGANAGLEQGFLVFDDDFAPMLPGVMRINLVRHLRTLLRLAGGNAAPTRTAVDTEDRFGVWYAQHQALPHFGWLHLAAPDGAEGLAEVDRIVGRVVARVQAAGVQDRTMIVFVGSHGRDVQGRGGLFDEMIHVPLIVVAPGLKIDVAQVGAQVRLMDVAATIQDHLRIDIFAETEGVSLLGYADGSRTATVWCALVGKDVDGNPLIGLRNNGVKWFRAVTGERLFGLDDDPGETEDLSQSQDGTLKRARALMAAEEAAFDAQTRLR